MKIFPAILYLLGIALSEWVTTQIDPIGGLICHLVIMLLLIIHASFTTARPDHKLYSSLSLVPTIRILSLSTHFLPLLYNDIYQYIIISIPVLAAAITAIRILHFQPSEVGLTLQKTPIQVLIQVSVGLTGAIFGFVEYQILSHEPMISALTWGNIWLPALIFLVATGFTEELVFRGVLQRSSLEVMGSWGLVYTSAAYSVLYISYFSWLHVLFAFLIGISFGWIVKQTGSLLGVSLSHGIINIGLYLILPFIFSSQAS